MGARLPMTVNGGPVRARRPRPSFRTARRWMGLRRHLLLQPPSAANKSSPRSTATGRCRTAPADGPAGSTGGTAMVRRRAPGHTRAGGDRGGVEELIAGFVAGSVPMRLWAEVIGTAPIERVDVLHGKQVVQTVRPYAAADLGCRVRVLWQGAEYRGRGRETMWIGKLTVADNRFVRFAAVNFLNPERKVQETAPGTALTWNSVTTGNLAGIDIWLEEAHRGTLHLETNIVSREVELASLMDNLVAFDGGGLGRRAIVYR